MSKVLLLVTWFYGGQPVNSYQVEFAELDACEKARAVVLADAKRLAAETPRGGEVKTSGGGKWFQAPGIPPRVSVVCIQR